MVLYNITMNVDKVIEKEWLSWMKSQYIGLVLSSDLFQSNKIFKLLSEDSQGSTYAFQFFAPSIENVMNYQMKFAESHHHLITTKFGDKVMTFNTLLEEIN